MAADPPTPALHRLHGDGASEAVSRLADQLHALSRLAETLTIRLLELEERLAAQEGLLLPHRLAAAPPDPGAMAALDRRLGDTQERLARLEAVLRAAEPPQAGRSANLGSRRSLHPVPEAPTAEGREPGRGPQPPQPLPAEGEPPFRDERLA